MTTEWTPWARRAEPVSELCSGVIFGQGKRSKDVIEVCEALSALAPESIPVNSLNPIGGTPLEGRPLLGPIACLKLLCLMRFYNPRSENPRRRGKGSPTEGITALGALPGQLDFRGPATSPRPARSRPRRTV